MNDRRHGYDAGGPDGPDPLPADLERRFFERQAREVMGRIALAERRQAGRRRAPAALAASLLAAALLIGLAVRTPAPVAPVTAATAAGSDWLFAWDLPMPAEDPLAQYDPAEDARVDLVDEDASAPAELASTDLLPPIDEDLSAAFETPEPGGSGAAPEA